MKKSYLETIALVERLHRECLEVIRADLDRLAINYCIRKNATSPSRLRRQREYVTRFGLGSLHDTYFGARGAREPIAALHAHG